jgi:hypothetical protein
MNNVVGRPRGHELADHHEPDFEAAEAVQYFYEPFLQAYDPALRHELGVWYTPPEVVYYMVDRVDQALRTQLASGFRLAALNA